MTDFSLCRKNLEAHGFRVSTFKTAAEAADYLNSSIDGVTVGFGGSITLEQLGLYEKLSSHNQVFWHWKQGAGEVPTQAASDAEIDPRIAGATADMYIASVNGLSETGELVNIDGTGNRIAAASFGHKKLWFVVGRNKLAPTLEEALWRARNIAAPKNAQRLHLKTPCAAKADHCYNCNSPYRICRGFTIHPRAMFGMETEIVLIDEDLGY